MIRRLTKAEKAEQWDISYGVKWNGLINDSLLEAHENWLEKQLAILRNDPSSVYYSPDSNS